MPPTLILIRHAEALHNATQDYSLPDPPLTELGEQQSAQLGEHLRANLPLAEQAELIVVSPMVRTLQTATLGLRWLIERGTPVHLDAKWQENSDKPCDTGSPVSALQPLFPSLDFSVVDPTYPDKTSPSPSRNPYGFTRHAVLARGQAGLRWLRARPEKVIIVVSHSGFLRCAVSARRYANADYRVFECDDDNADNVDGLIRLREWEQTEAAGGGMGRSEKGVASVLPRDFPRDIAAADNEVVVEGEATSEVPN
ncbi:histidine phosphatase superfamily [Phyllosticta citrichinensis]|uniref:Histidine phosphatase superfamily n=1 Tax=Phyllosticta citrichinensis TaxID=1130410 RepID=A0ABR1Y317_9PEZI